MTLLSDLYDTGARVQELCDLCVKDIRFEHSAIITLTGKGRKIRHVPILGSTVELMRIYLKENKSMYLFIGYCTRLFGRFCR